MDGIFRLPRRTHKDSASLILNNTFQDFWAISLFNLTTLRSLSFEWLIWAFLPYLLCILNNNNVKIYILKDRQIKIIGIAHCSQTQAHIFVLGCGVYTPKQFEELINRNQAEEQKERDETR